MTDFSKNKEAFQKLKKPKAIIFDWDNTLVNTWPLITESIDKTMSFMGKEPWGEKKVKDNVHKSMREYFPQLFGNKWEQAGEFYKKTYRDIHLKIKLLEGSKELLDFLSSTDITVFCISNKIGATLRKEAKSIGVADKFFSLIGAGDANSDKPAKDPVELALLGSDIDLTKDEIWFIGDTVTDVQCAFNSNTTPIIFGNDNVVSKTIPLSLIDGSQGDVVALYFQHQEMIDLLNKIQ